MFRIWPESDISVSARFVIQSLRTTFVDTKQEMLKRGFLNIFRGIVHGSKHLSSLGKDVRVLPHRLFTERLMNSFQYIWSNWSTIEHSMLTPIKQ